MQRSALEEWCWEVNRNVQKADDHGKDRNKGYLDDDGDHGRCTGWGLVSSGITHDSAHKVPEVLAVEQAKHPRPNSIDTSRDGNQTSPFVPDEVSHFD